MPPSASSPHRSAVRPTPRCGSAARRRGSSTADDRRRAGRRRRARSTRRRAAAGRSAAAATSSSPTRASPAPSCASRTTRSLRRPGRPAARSPSASPPASPGTTSSPRPSAERLAGIEACPASPAWRGPRRSRTSAPTARRSPQTIARCASGTGQASGGRAPSPPPTAASATAPAASRPSRRATSCSTVTFRRFAPARPRAAPVAYAELAAHPRRRGRRRARRSADVRDAVLDLRRGKGMVLDPADPDTWSAGSFFTNPVLGPPSWPAARCGRPRPRSGRRPPAPTERRRRAGPVKMPAAWLIEQAGFGKGYPGPAARPHLDQAHPRADQPRRRRRRPSCSPWPGRSRDGVRTRSGSSWLNEPVLVG